MAKLRKKAMKSLGSAKSDVTKKDQAQYNMKPDNHSQLAPKSSRSVKPMDIGHAEDK